MLDVLVQDEYARGTDGMRVKDRHWLAQPPALILQYNYNRKEQWAESIQLARIWFLNQAEHEAATNRRQRDLITDWLVTG